MKYKNKIAKIGVLFFIVFLYTGLNPVKAATGYERVSGNKYEILVEYNAKYAVEQGDGVTEFPIKYQVKMDAYWSGGVYRGPDSMKVSVYIRDASYPGTSGTWDNIWGVKRSWPASTTDNSASLQWSASVGNENFNFGATLNAPTASYDWLWRDPGQSSPSYSTINGNTFLYLGWHEADFPGGTVFDKPSKLVTGAIEVVNDNAYTDWLMNWGNGGDRIEIAFTFRLHWASNFFGRYARTVTYTFIVGDDIPSSTDVNLYTYYGTMAPP